MASLAREFESMKQAIKRQHHRMAETQKIRTVNTIKWKHLMLHTLQTLAQDQDYDHCLVEDLRTIVSKVPDDRFVEAIINLQPYKPQSELFRNSQPMVFNKRSIRIQKFELSPKKEGLDQVTTSAGSILKRSQLEELSAAKRLKSKQKLLASFIEEDVLSQEISSLQHPFTKIIEGYSTLLENKYRLKIQKELKENKPTPVDDFIETLAQDFKLLQVFFKKSSEPIVDIFELKDMKQKQEFSEEIHSFMRNHLRNHQKLCSSIRKIIRYYVKNSKELKQFEEHCPIQAEIQKFDIPTEFQIEGCYIYATSQLIAFSELMKGKDCLAGLSATRDAIYKDIDEYNLSNQQKTVQMQVSSAIQLEVLKFCLVKLRIFAGEILSGLLLLSTLYGEEMAFHYDEASYIHSQLTIAFQAIQHNL